VTAYVSENVFEVYKFKFWAFVLPSTMSAEQRSLKLSCLERNFL